MAFKGLDRMKKAMDKVQDLQDKDLGPFPKGTKGKGLEFISEEEYKNLPEMKKDPTLRSSPPKGVSYDEEGNIEYYKKGGKVKKMAKGGSVSSASKRADGCATKGKTKGRMI